MRAQVGLWGLLAVVAGAAAVLSFAGLRDLALLCGFSPRLAWLLPLVVDAGAAAGTLVWLGGARAARVFARALALVLLAGSVVGNGVGHGLVAYGVAPAWWVVVAVSAVAPAVLGAVVHLAVLATSRPDPALEVAPAGDAPPAPAATPPHRDEPAPALEDDPVARLVAEGAGRRRLARELSIPEHQARRLIAQHRNGAHVEV